MRAERVGFGADVTTSLFDVRGEIVASVNGAGTVTRVERGAFGNLRRISAPGIERTYVINEFGHTESVDSTEDGLREFALDGQGRIWATGNENGELIITPRDALGRVVGRIDNEGAATFTYDQSNPETNDASEIGRLVSEAQTSSVVGNHSASYEYHGPSGALTRITRIIDGEEFVTAMEYDSLSRPEYVHYPTKTQRPFTVRYQYDTYGSLREVSSIAPNLGSRSLWEARSKDAFGRCDDVRMFGGHVSLVASSSAIGNLDRQTTAVGGAQLDSIRYMYDYEGRLIAKLHGDLHMLDEASFTMVLLGSTSTQLPLG